MKRKNLFIIMHFLMVILVMTGCAQKEQLSVRQFGQVDAINISSKNKMLLPAEAVSFCLSPGDALRLETTTKITTGQPFLIERGDAVRLSFHYEGGEYHLMAGDRISIYFQNESPFNMTTTVRLDGRITIPRIGELIAAGRTPLEFGSILSDKFKRKEIGSNVSVSVVQSNMNPFTLMSGEYYVSPNGTIAIPILGEVKAQGLSQKALARVVSSIVLKRFNNPFKVSIYVQSHLIEQLQQSYDKVITVTPVGNFILPQIGNISVIGKTLPQVGEEIEDILQKYYNNPVDVSLSLISAVNNSAYVSGEVRFPGIYPLFSRMTTFKALALSGGVTPEGDLDEVVLIHYVSPENVTVYKTSLTEVLNEANSLNDLALSPQDIVFVPKTNIAEANQFIEQYITRMLPLSANITYNVNKIQ